MVGNILSICIPVYNRERELRECLESIEQNYVDGVEVIICDNHSTDRTTEVIREFENRLPIVWATQKENVGFDRNCMDVIAMSSGQYCWILGSDDKVCEGAIELLIARILDNESDIIHFGYKQHGVVVSPTNNLVTQPLVLHDCNSKLGHLSDLRNLSLAFMFISCFAFRRVRWLKLDSFLSGSLGTNYVHAFAMHSILNSKSSLLVINDFLVEAKVSQNEWTNDVGRFLFIDSSAVITINDRGTLGEGHFVAFCEVFKKSYPWYLIFKIMVAGGAVNFMKSRYNLRRIGYSRSGLILLQVCQTLGIFGALRIVLKVMRYIFRI